MIDITIKKNDAFRVLNTITRGHVRDLEKHIIGRLKNERLMYGEPEDCGMSVFDIAKANGMEADQIVDVLFPTVADRDEIPELINHVMLWCDNADHPCPECGCELEQEPDGEWIDIKCSNTECDFRDSTEPDHDIFPGGHSFDQ